MFCNSQDSNQKKAGMLSNSPPNLFCSPLVSPDSVYFMPTFSGSGSESNTLHVKDLQSIACGLSRKMRSAELLLCLYRATSNIDHADAYWDGYSVLCHDITVLVSLMRFNGCLLHVGQVSE